MRAEHCAAVFLNNLSGLVHVFMFVLDCLRVIQSLS